MLFVVVVGARIEVAVKKTKKEKELNVFTQLLRNETAALIVHNNRDLMLNKCLFCFNRFNRLKRFRNFKIRNCKKASSRTLMMITKSQLINYLLKHQINGRRNRIKLNGHQNDLLILIIMCKFSHSHILEGFYFILFLSKSY